MKEKVSEIFETLLGDDISEELEEHGYEFGQITIGK